MRATSVLAAPVFLLASLTVRADDLRIQCPAGTVAVLESETTVLCRPKVAPAPPPPPQPTTVIIQKPAPPPPPTSAGTPSGGMELAGLQSVPETCGLKGVVDFDVAENAAEALYLAVSACVETTDVNPPTKPARWLPVLVVAAERGHMVQLPNDAWAGTLQGCLLRKPPRFPKALRGKSFTAYYLLTSSAADRPPMPACLAH